MQEGGTRREQAALMGQLLACTKDERVTMNKQTQGCIEKVH